MLPNHLAQVAFAVVRVPRRVRYDVDNGYFFPGEQAQLVAHLQKGVILRKVRDANEITSQVLHQVDIAAVCLVIQCHSYGCLILMAVYSAQLVGFPVEAETLVSVKGKPAQSHVVVFLVEHFVGFRIYQDRLYRVELWIFRRPKHGLRYFAKCVIKAACLSRFESQFLFSGLQRFPCGVEKHVSHHERSVVVSVIGHFAAKSHLRVFLVYFGSVDKNAVRPHVVHAEMLFGCRYQPHVSVDATPKSEVGRNGSDILTAVVHGDFDDILFLDVGRDVEDKCGISARVAAYLFSVHANFRRFARRVYLEIVTTVGNHLGQGERTAIDAFSLIIVWLLISVQVIRVREIYHFPFRFRWLAEFPAVVDGFHFPLCLQCAGGHHRYCGQYPFLA